MTKNHYDVLVVGGGISGAALFYELAKYTDVKRIALVEKYERLAKLNSAGTSNSQTIHCGDIETNYTLEKAKKVKETASMIAKYCVNHGHEGKFLFAHQKMAIGVGDTEVEYMQKRYEEFKELYPYLEVFASSNKAIAPTPNLPVSRVNATNSSADNVSSLTASKAFSKKANISGLTFPK